MSMNTARFLIDASVSAATLDKYINAVSLFADWCGDNGYDAFDYGQLDDLITEYLHEIYLEREGVGKQLAADTVFGVMKLLPRCSNSLQASRASLDGWQRLHPGESYPPLTYELAVLISTCMARGGLMHYAVACLLAFDCFLRVGELANIRRSDVATAADTRLGPTWSGMAVRLRHTKTGNNQWVRLESEIVRQLVQLLLDIDPDADGDSTLFPFTAAQFRAVFKHVCAQLQLSSRYVPHSLRHGGATHWFMQGRSVDDILVRGRWASTNTARRYIQAGRALLLSVVVPAAAASSARLLALDVLISLHSALSQYHKCGVEKKRRR